MNMRDKILQYQKNPHELELLYAQDPRAFAQAISELRATTTHADALLIQAWAERLFFKNSQPEQQITNPTTTDRKTARSRLVLLLMTSLMAGALLRLFFQLNDQFSDSIVRRFPFTPANASFAILSTLTLYFVVRNQINRRLALGIGLATAILFATLNIITFAFSTRPWSFFEQSQLLVALHVPILLWALLGIAFAGSFRHQPTDRLRFLKYNGEVIVYFGVIALAGMLLTAITLGLFAPFSIGFEEIWFNYVVIFGVGAAPLVATALTLDWFGEARRIAPAIARIFSPILLVVLLAYLGTLGLSGAHPFTDREFLLTFNAMLAAVLAIIIFSISVRPISTRPTIEDVIATCLVGAALIANAIALSAIGFRLASYGFTPNRITVLGENLLIFANLAGIGWHYVRFLFKKSPELAVEHWIARYIPLYIIWAAIVVFAFPIIFYLW